MGIHTLRFQLWMSEQDPAEVALWSQMVEADLQGHRPIVSCILLRSLLSRAGVMKDEGYRARTWERGVLTLTTLMLQVVLLCHRENCYASQR